MTTATRMSVYSLMDDHVLVLAIGGLQVKLEQLRYCRGPCSSRLRDAYLDSLSAATNEFERRRA